MDGQHRRTIQTWFNCVVTISGIQSAALKVARLHTGVRTWDSLNLVRVRYRPGQ